MSNLSKLEFVALDISGNNYLSWVLDAEIHLDAKGLGATITNGNTSSSQDKAKAMIFLRHHLDEGLSDSQEDSRYIVRIYSVKNESWKNIGTIPAGYHLFDQNTVSLDDTVNMMETRSVEGNGSIEFNNFAIISLIVANEKFVVTPVPSQHLVVI
ncbi:uncharacterized protein [Solanum tuberosum]|uniref:uncharacterized protein n=1 Tax=Solanum tuberosum TaxID=4113 RepID=UPI00073A03E9|nr:PREDICTED: uncharacterized protein LOC107058317 [Solanum tuberosum]